MKYLKEYRTFEEAEFDISPNDTLNVKKSKEQLSVVRDYINEYNRVKSKLDLIYKNSKTDDEISKKVDELVGKDKEKRNPFLVSYLTVCEDERRLQKLIDSLSEDEMAKSKLKDMINMTTDSKQKQNINISINEINNRSARTKADISKLKLDIQKRRKDIELKMKDVMKGIQDDIKNIAKGQK
jgi:hypothetical protein